MLRVSLLNQVELTEDSTVVPTLNESLTGIALSTVTFIGVEYPLLPEPALSTAPTERYKSVLLPDAATVAGTSKLPVQV